jgi:hypothetical protein
MPSLAAETRDAVRARPLLYDALRAGIVNHRAAAAQLIADLPGDPDPDSVATALRRFATDLSPTDHESRRAPVRVRRGVGPVDEDPLLAVGETGLGENDGDRTALFATGDVDARALEAVLARLRVAGVGVKAAGVGGGADEDESAALTVVVADADRTAALRAVESALDAVPTG